MFTNEIGEGLAVLSGQALTRRVEERLQQRQSHDNKQARALSLSLSLSKASCVAFSSTVLACASQEQVRTIGCVPARHVERAVPGHC